MSRTIALLGLMMTVFLLSGCAQFLHFMQSKGGEPQLFGGVRAHAGVSQDLAQMSLTGRNAEGKEVLDQPQDWMTLGGVILWWEAIDLPLTILTDILMLPLFAYAEFSQ